MNRYYMISEKVGSFSLIDSYKNKDVIMVSEDVSLIMQKVIELNEAFTITSEVYGTHVWYKVSEKKSEAVKLFSTLDRAKQYVIDNGGSCSNFVVKNSGGLTIETTKIESEFINTLERSFPNMAKTWRNIDTTPKKEKKVQRTISPSGKRNIRFEEICRMTQSGLKNHLKNKYNMESGDGWLYKQGTIPVLLTAHMDTVHKENVAEIDYDITGNRISSPEGIGGDDRCGIYMIEKIMNELDVSVIFFEDEEIGSVGATKWIETKHCQDLIGKFNYIIELDRQGSKDVVYYDCGSEDFKKFISDKAPFFKNSWGTFSDICVISDILDASSCNFSCGYYNPHKTTEYVNLDEMEKVIEEVKRLILATDTERDKFVWVKKPRIASVYGNGWYDDYNDEYWSAYYSKSANSNSKTVNSTCELLREDLKQVTFAAQISSTGRNQKLISGFGATKYEAFFDLMVNYPEICVNDFLDFYCE